MVFILILFSPEGGSKFSALSDSSSKIVLIMYTAGSLLILMDRSIDKNGAILLVEADGHDEH